MRRKATMNEIVKVLFNVTNMGGVAKPTKLVDHVLVL